MGPDYDRWSDSGGNNVQAPLEVFPLEDTPIQVPLASRADVGITQDHGVPSEIQTQENTQTPTRAVELVDSQSSPALPIERMTIGTNIEDSNEVKKIP